MCEGVIGKRRYTQFHGNGMFHGTWCKDCDLEIACRCNEIRNLAELGTWCKDCDLEISPSLGLVRSLKY